jgi:type IV pilus assembly protein PilE
MNGRSQGQGGFTLIELLIAVVIVGILGAVAYASYGSFVKRGHRSEAKSALMQDATILERVFTQANRYDNDQPNGGGNATAGLIILQSPTSGSAVYTIAVAFGTPQDFTLTATPVGGGPMASDACGSLTLNNLGQQGVTGSASVSECWRK